MGYDPWGCKELDTTEAIQYRHACTALLICISDDCPGDADAAGWWGRGGGHCTLRPTGTESGKQHPIPSGLGTGAGTFVVLNIVD